MTVEAETNSAVYIEALRMPVLHGPSRLNVDQVDFPLFAPTQRVRRCQLRPIVTTNRFRHASQLACLFQSANRRSSLLAKAVGPTDLRL